MSECVVRMEMPKACWSCGFRFVCKAAYDFMTTKEATGCSVLKVGMEGCLIVCQLPEGHGRLGDLDELAAGCDSPHWCRWLSEIEDAPTIVPAEAERKVDAPDAVTPTDTPTDTPTVPAERSEHEAD